jgi:hypothetical protein
MWTIAILVSKGATSDGAGYGTDAEGDGQNEPRDESEWFAVEKVLRRLKSVVGRGREMERGERGGERRRLWLDGKRGIARS